jgi:hypothetical protein
MDERDYPMGAEDAQARVAGEAPAWHQSTAIRQGRRCNGLSKSTQRRTVKTNWLISANLFSIAGYPDGLNEVAAVYFTKGLFKEAAKCYSRAGNLISGGDKWDGPDMYEFSSSDIKDIASTALRVMRAMVILKLLK